MVNIVKSTSEKLKKAHEEDSRMVKGRFTCHDPKGGSVKFSFRKYKEDPVRHYNLVDGMEYELPVGVIKHLNNCGWEIHAHLLDKDGNPFVGTGKKEHRFSFQDTSFF